MFLETRVALVVDDLTGPVNYQGCRNSMFYDKAEEQGTVFTLQGFEQYIMSGEFKHFQDNIKHPNYLIVRFVDVHETCTEYDAERYDLDRKVYIYDESED